MLADRGAQVCSGNGSSRTPDAVAVNGSAHESERYVVDGVCPAQKCLTVDDAVTRLAILTEAITDHVRIIARVLV